MNRRNLHPLFLISSLICFSILLYGMKAQTESPTSDSSDVFKKEQDLVKVQMVQISRELGITCTECHSAKNFKDDTKANFRIARDHMKTVEVLRANGFNGKKYPEASCFTCHQGHLKFVSRMQHPEGAPAPSENKAEH